jgi:hypothetical protein
MVDENRPTDPPPANSSPDGPLEHPTVRHERTDADHRWIIGLLGAAVVLGILIQVGLWFLLEYHRHHQAQVKKSPFPLAPAPSEALPVEPRLEPLDRVSGIGKSNVYVREAAKGSVLTTYGPSEEAGFVRVPIDRAMQQLENKLPARRESAGDAAKANGLVNAGASNSGRLLQGSPR